MKKLMLLLFVFAGITVNAQFSIGGGLSYLGDAGVEVNSVFSMGETMSLSPSIDYYFPGEDMTRLAVNVDGHYNLGDPDSMNYYPIAGLNYYYFSYDMPVISYEGVTYGGGSFSDGQIGLNLGFGASYVLSDSMKFYGDLRYVMNDYSDDLGIALGILFTLGN